MYRTKFNPDILNFIHFLNTLHEIICRVSNVFYVCCYIILKYGEGQSPYLKLMIGPLNFFLYVFPNQWQFLYLSRFGLFNKMLNFSTIIVDSRLKKKIIPFLILLFMWINLEQWIIPKKQGFTVTNRGIVPI